jgi:exonuclease III
MEAEDKFSFPTPILIGTWRKPGEIVPTRERIDYILSSRTLARYCTHATILNTGIVDKLSDHFPVMATFDR